MYIFFSPKGSKQQNKRMKMTNKIDKTYNRSIQEK